jgi:hypothetical protein
MTQAEMKAWIDRATYAQLLSRWRFAAIGDPIFQGEVGAYYAAVLKRKRNAPGGHEEHVRASKAIGW